MNIYEDIHIKEVETHYHLSCNEDDNELYYFKEIIKILREKLPKHLHLRVNRNNFSSINIVNSKNQSYLFLNCYLHENKHRVKIIPYERGKVLLTEFFIPLIKTIK